MLDRYCFSFIAPFGGSEERNIQNTHVKPSVEIINIAINLAGRMICILRNM